MAFVWPVIGVDVQHVGCMVVFIIEGLAADLADMVLMLQRMDAEIVQFKIAFTCKCFGAYQAGLPVVRLCRYLNFVLHFKHVVTVFVKLKFFFCFKCGIASGTT